MLKTQGIPLWVTIFALVICLMGIASTAAMIFGETGGIDDAKSLSWSGRNLALGLIAGLAVILKNPAVYAAAFLGGLCREVGDLIGELSYPEPKIFVVVFLVVFLGVGSLALFKVLQALKEIK